MKLPKQNSSVAAFLDYVDTKPRKGKEKNKEKEKGKENILIRVGGSSVPTRSASEVKLNVAKHSIRFLTEQEHSPGAKAVVPRGANRKTSISTLIASYFTTS